MNKFFVAQTAQESPYFGQPQVLVIGNFDGVHQGHRELLRIAQEQAQKKGLPATVVTFDPHPLEILRPPHLRLFSLEDQQKQFASAGVDGVAYLSFSRDFSELTAEQFLEKILGPYFRPRVIVVGFNFRFGAGRTGTTELLKSWGDQNGCEVIVVQPVRLDAGVVSTSEIRKSLQIGDVRRARELLGRPFELAGIVVHGESRGHKIGFPTANLHFEKLVTPEWGVYATRTRIGSEAPRESVSHLGPLPTFEDKVVRLETHLLDFSRDLYGQTLHIEFVDKIRDVQKFSSVDQLREQIHRDVQEARRILGASK